MLKAFRSRDPSVHVVCYEDFVDDPTNYVPSRLSAMGLNVTAELGAEDGNEEFALKGYDCQSDMLAYAELCPKTSLAKQIRQSCGQKAVQAVK